MQSGELNSYISNIKPLDSGAMEKARARLDSLVKPPGSLGRLEDIAAALAGICGGLYYDARKRCVIIMSSDNGVVDETMNTYLKNIKENICRLLWR
jgi:nicotinate-nucleotide--dimethylbenzimidazole phosphoribosyltransferase